jgi:hypothetical protein
MKSMQVGEFLVFLKQRIDWHYEKMAGTLSYNRVLIKTEKAEAEVILSMFLEILNDRLE